MLHATLEQPQPPVRDLLDIEGQRVAAPGPHDECVIPRQPGERDASRHRMPSIGCIQYAVAERQDQLLTRAGFDLRCVGPPLTPPVAALHPPTPAVRADSHGPEQRLDAARGLEAQTYRARAPDRPCGERRLRIVGVDGALKPRTATPVAEVNVGLAAHA